MSAQLAAPVRDRVVLGEPVESLERAPDGWRVATAGRVRTARLVLVATDPATASRLAGTPDVPMRGCVTWWFATEEVPTASTMLHLHPGGGPVINTAVISNVSPSYAPPGQHLISAVTLAEAPEAQVRAELEVVYGRPTAGWRVVVRHAIPHSLPAVAAPRKDGSRTQVDDGLYVAGDHRAHASIQGALVSGRRAAGEIRAALLG